MRYTLYPGQLKIKISVHFFFCCHSRSYYKSLKQDFPLFYEKGWYWSSHPRKTNLSGAIYTRVCACLLLFSWPGSNQISEIFANLLICKEQCTPTTIEFKIVVILIIYIIKDWVWLNRLNSDPLHSVYPSIYYATIESDICF